MPAMTKRERVEAAIRHLPVDRPPLYDLLRCDDVIEYFTGVYPPYGEEGARVQAVACDRMLDMARGVGHGPVEPPAGFTTDPVLLSYARTASLTYRQHPIATLDAAARWVDEQIAALREQLAAFDAAAYREHYHGWFRKVLGWLGDDPLSVCLRQSGVGLDHIRGVVGIEFFAYLCADRPEPIDEYLELACRLELAMIHAVADASLSPWALTYGDIAMKHKLLHSPAWLREHFFGRLARLNAAYHEHGLLCLFHSDGYLMEVMDDIIAAGSDGLNPIETVAGMDLAELYQRCGRRLFYTGGIDMSQLLARGTPDQVREVCRAALAAAPTGYLMGSTTEIDNSSHLDCVLAMVECAWGEPPRPAHPGVREQIARRRAAQGLPPL